MGDFYLGKRSIAPSTLIPNSILGSAVACATPISFTYLHWQSALDAGAILTRRGPTSGAGSLSFAPLASFIYPIFAIVSASLGRMAFITNICPSTGI